MNVQQVFLTNKCRMEIDVIFVKTNSTYNNRDNIIPTFTSEVPPHRCLLTDIKEQWPFIAVIVLVRDNTISLRSLKFAFMVLIRTKQSVTLSVDLDSHLLFNPNLKSVINFINKWEAGKVSSTLPLEKQQYSKKLRKIHPSV